MVFERGRRLTVSNFGEVVKQNKKNINPTSLLRTMKKSHPTNLLETLANDVMIMKKLPLENIIYK